MCSAFNNNICSLAVLLSLYQKMHSAMCNVKALADKINAVHSGSLFKKNMLLAFFASGKLSWFRCFLCFSHEEEKLVMEVWVSFFVLVSYEGINPFSWNTAETGWMDHVFTPCLSSSIQHASLSGTHFWEDSLFLSLTLSARTILTERAHINAQFSFHNQKTDVSVWSDKVWV